MPQKIKQKPRRPRNRLEEALFSFLGKAWIYEPFTIPFVQPSKERKYLPDFANKKDKNLIIEGKGRLVSEDRKKLLWVKEQHPELRIIIIFGKADNKLFKGSKTTYGDWAQANGFEWYDIRNKLPKNLKG